MSLIVQIQEIVSGPVKDLYLELTSVPLFTLPAFPPVNLQIGPENVGDIPLGSSFGDANLGSSFGDFAPSFGSSNGDQNLGSSGLTLPALNISGLDLPSSG